MGCWLYKYIRQKKKNAKDKQKIMLSNRQKSHSVLVLNSLFLKTVCNKENVKKKRIMSAFKPSQISSERLLDRNEPLYK